MHSHSNDLASVSRKSVLVLALAATAGLAACGPRQPKAGTVQDEAMRARRTVASFTAADEDYFHDMDGALPLTKEQVEGRNMWMVWSGGNDWLWDVLATEAAGSLDWLKTVSSHPSLPYSRDNRWTYLGLVNEPCFKKATGPDPNRYGLWLDVRDPACGADPYANADKYRVSGSAPGDERCRSGRSTASPRASSDSDCSRTRISTRRPGSSGIRIGTIATRRSTTRGAS